ncbi:MAG: DivIVA domain-containing protein [Christensenella sp.]|nr:DivIVA domain-containing protein [Christensenella sp.]
MRIDDIVNKVFSRSFMGYDIEQVDGFLDEIIEALERYESEKREMLNAMEYLMKKIEHGQKVPLADMKKAIDSGRTAQKKVSTEDAEPPRAEEAKAARSIARGAGASKPVRTQKINRVKAEQDAKEQIIQEANAELPPLTPEEAALRAKSVADAAANWLDELLINIAEHESLDYEKPLQGAEVRPPEPRTYEQPKMAAEKPESSKEE